MKTNQMMTVKIGNEHTVQIGHLTKMGNLNDILKIGNLYRKENDLREIEISEWLRKESTWEFIIEVERKYGTFFQTVDSAVCLSDYKNESGKIEFGELIKKFSVIKSQRGGKPENRGYWANLHIMIDLAIYLSPILRLEMIDIFINHKLLEWRDLGGDNFNEFNKVVDMLSDLNGNSKIDVYKYVSIELRKKQNILDTRGYNEKDHDSKIQETRAKWLEYLTFSVRVGFVQSFYELVEVIKKL
jgi:hypothetical protein